MNPTSHSTPNRREIVKETPAKAALQITTPSDREVAMIRTFAAPKQLVFEAWTRPELIRRWLGIQNGWTMAACEVDLRVGGAYRYLWRRDDGREMAMGGTYSEISRPDRIVNTETFDDPWYSGGAIVTTTFVETAGRTTVTSTMKYDSQEARDQVIASPMERGIVASYALLDQILAGQI